jgi:uncharacterized repeat protein (TIGR01451 family)/fimbrial isopeptide formation D2 family protein
VEGPVSADDSLGNIADINGLNPTSGTTTPDSSQASIMVTIPSITKELLGYYYEDGTAKSYDVAAPGDEVEFRITYSSIGLNAQQRDIEIDEYAPENMGPLTAALPVTYGGTLPGPFAPVTVSPNGLRWSLGTLPGDTLWTATFKVPVQDIEFTGARNNLAKLAGSNTEEFAYSDRDQVEVLFGEPNIEFEKTVSGPDVTAIKAGEIYTYSITVSNPQNEDLTVTDAFEMDLTDVIPDNLAYNGVFSVTGTGTHTTPVFSGQNVSMTISQLAPGESLTFSYEVVVEPTVVAGSTLVNEAVLQRPYSQPSRSYQFPGDPFTDSAVLNTEGLVISKLITPVFAKIGDTVTYILQVTVPEGTAAYNVQTADVFPDATQDYIVGSATKDGVPIVPTVSGGTVTFPTVPFVDASEAEVTMIYSFKVRITGGTFASPYISYQTDYATVSWDIDDQGTPADPFTTSEVLQVRTPSLTATKEQRNATTGGNFTTSLRSYTPGDVIQYRISVQNNGTETAYDSVITDVIDPLLSYVVGSITVTNGSAAVTGGTLVWNIPEIAASGTAVLTFSVNTLAGVASNGRITNNATYIYNTNNNGFGFLRGPFTTNTVQLRSPSARITKTASLSEGEIGDDITYTITVTVPENTIAYTPTVSDILPVGQTYIGPATRQQLPLPAAPIVPTVSGQNITFPVNPDITAVGGDVTIIYTFTARITDATHAQPYEETQTDSARVEWAIEPGGTSVRSSNTSLSITARTPHITILKEQRNDTDGGSYTTANISALPGDVVHYRFTITSDGASPAYNINLNDVLSDDLSYSGIVAAPTAGTVTPPTAPPDATLIWNIPQLDSGQSATLEFAVIVNSGIGAFSAINDLASATYDSNDVNPVTYPAASNQVTIDIPALEFVKSASTTTAAIGDTITYTLTVEIPDGVVAYNLELKDEIPVGQEYVPGSWSPGVPTSTPNEVIYNEPVTPIVGPQTLVFTFDTVVVSGRQTPPYTQIQPNRARLTWDLTPDGPMAPAVLDTIDIEVLTPHITARKEQRNVTQGGGFTTDPLIGVATNDTVEYRITLENDGAGTAYNIVTSDTLDPSLTYTGVVTPPPGTVVSSVSPGDPDGTITWTESTLSAGASVVLVFSVLVNAGPAPGTAVSDQTSTVYDTALVNPSTLGPTLSNQVAFNFNNPVITKAIDKESAFVGDTVTYTVSITIPNGNIAYDVQVSDMLPAGQSYVSESLTRNGVPVSSPTLTFPSEGTIDATAGEVTIVYTFDAVIDSIASSPQEEQINSSTIEWNIAPGGPAGTPQNAEVGVFVTDSSITVEKQQRNFTTGVPASFTTAPVDVSVGDVVYYQFTATNPSANTIYNVSIDDVLSPYLQFNGSVTPPAAGIITHTGGTVNWSIDSIPAFTSYSAVFAVTVLPGASAQSTIENTTSATFTATATNPVVVYGPTTFNTVELILPSLLLEKSVSNETVRVGEIITYTLTLTVPAGTIAYNAVVSDTLPSQQLYMGSATRNGVPVLPSQAGQTITFNTESVIDATAGEVVIVYTFKARPTVGSNTSPYTQVQQNTATVNYDIDTEGTPAVSSTAQQDITVFRPFVEVLKEQRTVTGGTGFTANDISVLAGDVVQFRLTATNSGSSEAYQVVLTDVLGDFLQYNGVVSSTNGTVVYDSGTKTLTWTLDTIAADSAETLVFAAQILPGISAGGTNSNLASALYDSDPQTPIEFGPTVSNTVQQIYPNVQITKSADPVNASVGDIITYTVHFLLPNGTVAYNAQFTDVIPIGQTYHNNATLEGVPIVPEQVSGQFVAFPSVPFADATGGALDFTYQFETVVVSANVDPVTLTETQTNEARGNWYLDPETPAPPVDDTADVIVTNSSITVGKKQRNVTTGGNFTTDPINAFQDQIVEFALTVTNSGPNTVYDVILSDVLSSNLAFVSAVSVPSGTLTHSGEAAGGTVTWTVPSMNAGESLTAVFSVRVLVGTLTTIENDASSSFRIAADNPTRYGTTQVTNTTEIDVLPPLSFVKTTSKSTATIGDTITYTLTVEIPSGVTAYDVQVIDTLTPEQQYVSGSWSPGTPTVTGTEISYTEPVSPLTGPMTLVYTFDAVVVSANLQAPYTQIQRNKAEVLWNIEPSGPAAPPVSDFAEVEVLVPHLTSLKEQRNVTQGGAFTTAPLLGVETDDVVEYRITLTNDGAGTAYNIVTSDPLDPSLTFTSVVTPPPGTVVSSVSPGDPDGTVTWTEASLAAGASVALTFSVVVNAGPAPGTGVFNQASSLYNTAAQNPTTLGPVLSNQVGFNYSNPVMVKTVAPQNVFVGDTVTYTAAFTIPDGNIAYDVQVTDLLPDGQSYVPNSLTRNGVPLLSSPTLTFPNEGTVDATAGAVTVTYTFDAVVDSIAVSPHEEQVNSATLNWNIAQGGPAGAPQTGTVTVNATDSDIVLSKAQRNFTTGIPAAFTTEQISASVGDVIYYELSVTNPSELYPVYNVSAEDELSTLLRFDGLTAPPDSGVVIHSGESAGGTVRWRINSIPPLTTYKAVFAVTVLAGGGVQSTIPNNFNAVFTADDVEPLILYGPRVSNTVLAGKTSPLLDLTKNVSSSIVQPGQMITYTMKLVIPKGTTAYHLQLSDELPFGQSYAGNAARNGVPVVPIVTDQTLMFQEEPILDARNEAISITYTFDAKIDSLPPQNETQTNQATVNWATDPQGTPGTPAQASVDIHVLSPNLIIEKEQRNASCGGTFTKDEIAVRECDSIEYRITVKNTGTAPAYAVVIQDILSQFNFFLRINEISSGDVRFIAFGNFVEWTLESIDAGAKKVLTFTVEAVCGTPAHAQTENSASVIYAANPFTPVPIGPVSSNIVVQKYANLHLAMCCNARCISPWHIVTVHAAVAVMPGTAAYDVKFSGILPCGLQFAGNAKRNGCPVDVEICDNVIHFPTETAITAASEKVIVYYQFDIKADSCMNRCLEPCWQTVMTHVDWSVNREGSLRFSEDSCCELLYIK